MINDLDSVFKKIDDVCFFNSKKLLDAFRDNCVSEDHFNTSTGYGYNDSGRDKIDDVYSSIFKSEDSLVRSNILSGTHAISISLFGLLNYGDTMLCITGDPYDTLHEVIGIKNNPASLISKGIVYDKIDLVDNDFNYDSIVSYLKDNKVKIVYIQRSTGYSDRNCISINQLEKVIDSIRKIDKEVFIVVDNCYCEFVSKQEPIEVGADIAIGSLIKNLGGSIARGGGYVTGRKDLIELIAYELTVPGQGKEVGSSFNENRNILQGLYLAPSVVAAALKTAVYTSYRLSELGFNTLPKYVDNRSDIVQKIMFNDEKMLVKYCKLIGKYSPINSSFLPEPEDMPGYDNKVIMAAGAFNQGSSIEMSCDGPLRDPFIAYQQGAVTYEYGKYIIDNVINDFKDFYE